MEFTSLERAVLEWMASHTKVANLAEQLATCRPTKRDFTGVGSFTKLAVPSRAPRIDLQAIRSPIIGPWIEACEGIQDGGSAVLFLDESGYAETLEMVANGEHFDEAVTAFSLRAWIEPNAPNGGSVTRPGYLNITDGPPSAIGSI